jgi:hypothetical protein
MLISLDEIQRVSFARKIVVGLVLDAVFHRIEK